MVMWTVLSAFFIKKFLKWGKSPTFFMRYNLFLQLYHGFAQMFYIVRAGHPQVILLETSSENPITVPHL